MLFSCKGANVNQHFGNDDIVLSLGSDELISPRISTR